MTHPFSIFSLSVCFFALPLISFSAPPAQATRLSPCPLTSENETFEDCPWASIARAINQNPQAISLQELAPHLFQHIREDSQRKNLLNFWGQSFNYDEYAKATIVERPSLEQVANALGLPLHSPPSPHQANSLANSLDSHVVHAGMEHTYAYLFSTLKTPFGYKRSRWVKGEIEAGFSLPPGTLGPTPSQGTLLSNITAFIGSLAFTQNPKQLSQLGKSISHVPAEVRKFDYQSLNRSRMVEYLPLSPSHIVELITDFVWFKNKPVDSNKNSILLIYSLKDPNEGGQKLISTFPVQAGFVENLMKPENIGKSKPIHPRYNAYVKGYMGTPLLGERLMVSAEKLKIK